MATLLKNTCKIYDIMYDLLKLSCSSWQRRNQNKSDKIKDTLVDEIHFITEDVLGINMLIPLFTTT